MAAAGEPLALKLWRFVSTNSRDLKLTKDRLAHILRPKDARVPHADPSRGERAPAAVLFGDAIRDMASRMFDRLVADGDKDMMIAVSGCVVTVVLLGYMIKRWIRGGEGGGGGEEEEEIVEYLRIANLDMNTSGRTPVTSKSKDWGENVSVKFAAASMQGWLENMEDAEMRYHCTEYCARQFHLELFDQPDYQNNLTNAMQNTIFRLYDLLDDECKEVVDPRNWIQSIKTGVSANYWPFNQATPYKAQPTGSAVCVAAIRANQIIVGNVGDSRCVLSRNGQAIELSTVHKPNCGVERQRIEKAGGQVTRDKVLILAGGQVLGQWLGAYRINGTLSVSRVIGDFSFKNKNLASREQMVTCDPELRTMEITNDLEFFVIGSDSLWKCMSSQDVVRFVHQQFNSGEADLHVICERLVDRGLPSADNVTAILVQFKNAGSLIP